MPQNSLSLRPANIWAIGRNYADHAKELGNAVPQDMVVFLKAGSCLQAPGKSLSFPSPIQSLHHEVELGLILGPDLEVDAATVAVDFTDRDLQSKLKKEGLPWTLAKSFRGSCAAAPPIAVRSISELAHLPLKLWVNDQLRQNGNTSDMIFSVEKILSHVRTHFPVLPGDLILTGTPAGVAAVTHGDVLRVEITSLTSAQWEIQFAHG